MDDRILTVPFDGPSQDDRSPYFGSQSPTGGVWQPRAGFAPTVPDAEFCEAVAVINSRPQPSGDDFLQVVVASQYFEAIESYVPAELVDSFGAVAAWAEAVVAKGSFEDSDEPSGDAMAAAAEKINGFVDKRCLGLA